MSEAMINSSILAKHDHSSNVLPTEVKEKFDRENSFYETKNMKLETPTFGNEGIMEF